MAGTTAGAGSAYGKIQALSSRVLCIGRNQRESQPLGQVSDGRGTIAVDISGSGIRITVSKYV
jgi:hypothetical protein